MYPTNKKISIPNVGGNIRYHRKKAGLTLKELSVLSEVSIGAISKIETGKISGGFESIYKIARALHILVSELIKASNNKCEPAILHKHDSKNFHQTNNYTYFPQAIRTQGSLNGYQMEILNFEVPAASDWSNHDGEELIIVMSGKIELHLEGETCLKLEQGDSACFDCGIRHAFVSVGDSVASIYSVSTRSSYK